MKKDNFIVYLLGELENILIQGLQDNMPESRMIEQSRFLIENKLSHISRAMTEAWMVDKKGGKNE